MTWSRGDRGMSSPWQDINGRRKAATGWSSSFTNCTACSERCCGPRMQRVGEQSLLFPIQPRKVPREDYPWHQVQPARPTAQRTTLLAMGALPRDGKWGNDFLPAMITRLQELEWLATDDTLPQGHGHVSIMELAPYCETHAGRPLPPTPQSRFAGTELSLQEKGRVVRLAVTLMGKAAGRESILPARIINHCRSLVPLGASPVVGVKGRPLFTRPIAVWHHLKRLQWYNAERWAHQQQSRVAKQRQKRRRARGQSADMQKDNTRPREQCPGKGGAKTAARAYTSDLYAGPILPEGVRRGVQYGVEEPSGDAATPAPGGGAVVFTPPQRCAVARCPQTGLPLPRLWLCAAHNHRQCSTCAAMGRGVRQCCA